MPSSWTIAVGPDASAATSWAWETEILALVSVVKTAPPLNSMPMLSPLTTTPRMAVIVIRIETPYQTLRLPMKSSPTSPG